MSTELQKLMSNIAEWSDKTFDRGNFTQARCVPISHHLQKEAKELTEALERFMKHPTKENCELANKEFADVFMLLLDSAFHYGLLGDTLIKEGFEKLEINKERTWGEPDENGVVEHIRKEEKEKVFNPLCPKCHGKGWYLVPEWIGDLQGRKDCNCEIK